MLGSSYVRLSFCSLALAGAVWGQVQNAATEKAMKELLGKQRPDGGWSDLATGKSLYALQTTGLPASDAAYQRAVKFPAGEHAAGRWLLVCEVARDGVTDQYFDAGFPHGFDQWISAAGTSWATMALSQASSAGQ